MIWIGYVSDVGCVCLFKELGVGVAMEDDMS